MDFGFGNPLGEQGAGAADVIRTCGDRWYYVRGLVVWRGIGCVLADEPKRFCRQTCSNVLRVGCGRLVVGEQTPEVFPCRRVFYSALSASGAGLFLKGAGS
jgi:hypothetical protein